MRVLTTQMYFDPSDIGWKLNKPQPNPGVAAAWFRLEEWSDAGALYKTLEAHLAREKTLIGGVSPFDRIFDLTEIWIQGIGVESALSLLGRPGSLPHANERIAKFLLETEIIFEQSPPKSEKLQELLKRSPGALIGTYLGYNSVPEGYGLLMWITIPLGIIVISSAMGIGNGLYNGLNKWVEARFKKSTKAH